MLPTKFNTTKKSISIESIVLFILTEDKQYIEVTELCDLYFVRYMNKSKLQTLISKLQSLEKEMLS